MLALNRTYKLTILEEEELIATTYSGWQPVETEHMPVVKFFRPSDGKTMIINMSNSRFVKAEEDGIAATR